MRHDFIRIAGAGALAASAAAQTAKDSAVLADAQETSVDVRARETEQKMTDDERFSMIISLLGAVPSIGVPRDKRIPEGVSMSAGYTPGIRRLGVPALQSSGATAFPASIVVGSRPQD